MAIRSIYLFFIYAEHELIVLISNFECPNLTRETCFIHVSELAEFRICYSGNTGSCQSKNLKLVLLSIIVGQLPEILEF